MASPRRCCAAITLCAASFSRRARTRSSSASSRPLDRFTSAWRRLELGWSCSVLSLLGRGQANSRFRPSRPSEILRRRPRRLGLGLRVLRARGQPRAEGGNCAVFPWDGKQRGDLERAFPHLELGGWQVDFGVRRRFIQRSNAGELPDLPGLRVACLCLVDAWQVLYPLYAPCKPLVYPLYGPPKYVACSWLGGRFPRKGSIGLCVLRQRD